MIRLGDVEDAAHCVREVQELERARDQVKPEQFGLTIDGRNFDDDHMRAAIAGAVRNELKRRMDMVLDKLTELGVDVS